MVFQIERRLPCGSWVRTQRIEPHKVELSEIPEAIKRPCRRGGPSGKHKIIEAYARLVLDRWDAARPKVTHRLVKVT